MSGTWYFPSNAHGKKPGFNDAGIDIFHGDPVGSLVRESIQNSLDAAVGKSEPVRVAFTLSELDSETNWVAENLKGALELGLEKAKNNQDRKATFFYEHALKVSGKPEGNRVLGIHDFETRGLTGTTDDALDERSAWLALVKGSGDTYKESAGAGGSYGHGSSAPLALSGFRSVLYYTQIQTGDQTEERFQGTSRLESLPAEPLIGLPGFTQDQGHFGDGEKCGPLLGSDIPPWFKNDRLNAKPSNATSIFGTSIFVMAPRIDTTVTKFWDLVRIAVLANYFYTIALGKLEVSLGDQIHLTSESIYGYLESLQVESEDESGAVPGDTIDRLETSRTISGNHRTHNLNVPGFGSVDLFLRMDDSIARSHVGIARSNGMLITREPRLFESKNYGGLKKFDLFVFVKDEEGSEVLRQLEPPAHNAFEPERIDDPKERDRVWKLYRAFKAAVWSFLKEETKHAVVEEIVLDDLSKYFLANWSGELAGDNDPTNYAMVYGSFRRMKAKQGVAVWGDPEDTVGVAPRRGQQQLGGKKKGLDPNFDDPLGEDEKKGRTSRRQVSDFRVDRDPKQPDRATVFFNAVDKVHRNLVILRSGADLLTEPVLFKTEKSDEWTSRLDLASVSKNERKRLRLVFEPGVLSYALEARLES